MLGAALAGMGGPDGRAQAAQAGCRACSQTLAEQRSRPGVSTMAARLLHGQGKRDQGQQGCDALEQPVDELSAPEVAGAMRGAAGTEDDGGKDHQAMGTCGADPGVRSVERDLHCAGGQTR